MDDITLNQNPKLGSVDRPNSYIGRSLTRDGAIKHLEGKGQFVDDLIFHCEQSFLDSIPSIIPLLYLHWVLII